VLTDGTIVRRTPQLDDVPRADDRLGFLGVGLQSREVAQAGYFVLDRARGRGIASSALQLFVHWAFNELELIRVQALIEPWNEASIHVAERAGFRREGLLRRYFKRRDVLMYAVVADDPR
jgi:ribosomal-protein-alanine N-acetyltransferase